MKPLKSASYYEFEQSCDSESENSTEDAFKPSLSLWSINFQSFKKRLSRNITNQLDGDRYW